VVEKSPTVAEGRAIPSEMARTRVGECGLIRRAMVGTARGRGGGFRGEGQHFFLVLSGRTLSHSPISEEEDLVEV